MAFRRQATAARRLGAQVRSRVPFTSQAMRARARALSHLLAPSREHAVLGRVLAWKYELLYLSRSCRWSFVLRRDRFRGPSAPGRLPARG